MKRPVPKATVERLPVYLQCLSDLDEGSSRISSEQLATRAGVNSAKVRKDLSFLGTYGTRGVGYDVDRLKFQIETELGLTEECPVVLVGVGNLGRALANYGGFRERGFDMVGVFDADAEIVGTRVNGLVVRPMDKLPTVVREQAARIGVIATPAGAAQAVAEQLAKAGIRSILNFAPAVIRLNGSIEVRQVDLSTELQILSYYLHLQG